jgi:glycine cleavage system H protein
MNIPQNLRYSNDHEWAATDGSIATVGITEFAVGQLGDITLVELPQVGDMVKAGASIGTVESVKAVSDILAPLSGKVVALNGELEDAPEKVNEDCHGDGWMLKIELADRSELERLMDAKSYEAFLSSLED